MGGSLKFRVPKQRALVRQAWNADLPHTREMCGLNPFKKSGAVGNSKCCDKVGPPWRHQKGRGQALLFMCRIDVEEDVPADCSQS